MKTPKIYLLIFLLLSSCATTRQCSDIDEYSPVGGSYILKNMTEDQIRKLAEESGFSFDSLRLERDKGNIFNRYMIIGGDTIITNIIIQGAEPKDILPLIRDYIVVSITPNPTYTSVSFHIFSTFGKDIDMLTSIQISCNFQLVFNERIIHQ